MTDDMQDQAQAWKEAARPLSSIEMLQGIAEAAELHELAHDAERQAKDAKDDGDDEGARHLKRKARHLYGHATYAMSTVAAAGVYTILRKEEDRDAEAAKIVANLVDRFSAIVVDEG